MSLLLPDLTFSHMHGVFLLSTICHYTLHNCFNIFPSLQHTHNNRQKLVGHTDTVEDVVFMPGSHTRLASVGDDKQVFEECGRVRCLWGGGWLL